MLALVALLLSTMAPTQSTPAPTPPKPFDCSAPEHRQFDFWIGEWDVVPNASAAGATGATGATGAARKPASNVIEKAHKGCVIVENWDDRTGGTGQSFNIYDRMRKQWHQTWVDTSGGLHQYWGELKDGNMVLVGNVPLPPTAKFAGYRTIRVTFFPLGPDKVRQFSEALGPDGTWTVNYDLIYTRRAKTK